MIKRLTDFIARYTNLKTILISAALVIIIEIFFSQLTPVFTEATGGNLLDMSVGFSAEFAYERLTSFVKASDVYFKIRALDFFFPICYAFALSLLSSWIYRKKYEDISNYRWILAVPFTAAAFDYIENIILVVLYRALPAQFELAAKVLNIVTILKFSLLGLSILLLIAGAFSVLKGEDSMFLTGNKFKGKKKE